MGWWEDFWWGPAEKKEEPVFVESETYKKILHRINTTVKMEHGSGLRGGRWISCDDGLTVFNSFTKFKDVRVNELSELESYRLFEIADKRYWDRKRRSDAIILESL